MKFETFGLFSIKEKTILICGIAITKLIELLPNFKELRLEKKQFDELIDKGFRLRKVSNKKFSLKYTDEHLGPLNIILRRKSSDYLVSKQVFEDKSNLQTADLYKKHFDT